MLNSRIQLFWCFHWSGKKKRYQPLHKSCKLQLKGGWLLKKKMIESLFKNLFLLEFLLSPGVLNQCSINSSSRTYGPPCMETGSDNFPFQTKILLPIRCLLRRPASHLEACLTFFFSTDFLLCMYSFIYLLFILFLEEWTFRATTRRWHKYITNLLNCGNFRQRVWFFFFFLLFHSIHWYWLGNSQEKGEKYHYCWWVYT